MRNEAWRVSAALVLVCTAMGPGAVQAQETAEDPVAAMVEAVSPDEHHDMLEPLVGRWKTRVSMWDGPGAEPAQYGGTATFEWVLDGRYLRQSYRGTFMEMPFNGLGYTGYDKAAGHYVSVWMDNFGTGIMHEIGFFDAEAGVFTFQGTFYDPVSGHRMTTRSEQRLEGPDRIVIVMWVTPPGGIEFKSMEIEYTR